MNVDGKKFAVFDIDGTLIRWQLFHAIVHHLGKNGHISDDDYKKIKDSMMAWKDRNNQKSFDDYEDKLVSIYIKSLPNIKPIDYGLVVDQVFNQYKDQLFVYTRDLLAKLKSQGYFLIAISGSQDEIVQKLADYHGFNAALGAHLVIKDGNYTGEITSPIFNKKVSLDNLVNQYNLSYQDSIGVGDTKSDISMLQSVENAIAFNPNNDLFTAAKENKWQIVIERKNVVYTLQPSDNNYVLKGDDNGY